ncbi:MAG TPA: response regulator transcription factor [Burkholderiales bacterium]
MSAPVRDELPTLLIVDDDRDFCRVLSRTMEKRGFAVSVAHSVDDAKWVAKESPPEYALVDLKMPGPSGLALVQFLKQLDPETRIVVLTGYASIATAVEAIKLGATHYLAKPAAADDIVAAFHRDAGDHSAPVRDEPLPLRRLEWEHIQKVLIENSGNISATAKQLKVHRRTLQRRLAKYPVK